MYEWERGGCYGDDAKSSSGTATLGEIRIRLDQRDSSGRAVWRQSQRAKAEVVWTIVLNKGCGGATCEGKDEDHREDKLMI